MNIKIAETDEEIASCFAVMRELRPHLLEEEFVSRIRSQQRQNFRLAMLVDQNEVVAVSGFRISENLAWRRFMYVDDLVTATAHRSKNYGAKFLQWLRLKAAEENCQELHLDSGFQRTGAHRFYARENLPQTGFHFAEQVK